MEGGGGICSLEVAGPSGTGGTVTSKTLVSMVASSSTTVGRFGMSFSVVVDDENGISGCVSVVVWLWVVFLAPTAA